MLELGIDLCQKCWKFGIDLTNHYEAGGSPQSLVFSSHGAERNPCLIAESKAAECICSVRLGLDPFTAVKWSIGVPDNGFDLLSAGKKIDVKAIGLSDSYLIWPVRKNAIYETKDFDVMICVTVENDFLYFWGDAVGWIGKAEFANLKKIAGKNGPLTAGTWHLHRQQLLKLEQLRR
jgi:hypothetical protein